MYKSFSKDSSDCTVALLVLLLLSPVFVVTLFLAIANEGNLLSNGGPGYAAGVFDHQKFKTMNDRKRPLYGPVTSDHVRLTSVGKFVRKNLAG